MATIVLPSRNEAASPSLRDKIRLFERNASSNDLKQPSRITHKFSSNPLSPIISPASKEIDRSGIPSVEGYRREEVPRLPLPSRGVSVEYTIPPLPTSPSLPFSPVFTPTQSTDNPRNSPRSSREEVAFTSPITSPRQPKWNVLATDPNTYKPPVLPVVSEKGKRETEGEEPSFTEEGRVVSPRKVVVEKQVPPVARKYQEEIIKLKRMTEEDKEIVKGLIKLSKQKNKMIDTIETNVQVERETIRAQVEAEQGSVSAKLQTLELELVNKSRELAAETMRCNEMVEKLRKLNRDKQELQLAVTTARHESRQCKILCDAEIYRQSQSIMDMAAQINTLVCLRQSMNCIICEEAVGVVVLDPCHHMVMCPSCAHKVQKCPMCRVDIRNRFEIFNTWVL